MLKNRGACRLHKPLREQEPSRTLSRHFRMLVLRLQRVGRENVPAFRITVSEKTLSAKKGAHEILGHFLPAENPPVFECDTERVKHWISKGAKPSDTLARLLKKNGMEGMDKYIEKYTKQKKKGEEPEAPAAAPAPAAPKEEPKKEEAPAAEAAKEEPKKEEAPAAEAPKEESKKE